MHRVLTLCLLTYLSVVNGDSQCTSKTSSCSCSTSAGEINLKPLDNPTSPMNWQQSGAFWAYSYNPCTAFACGSAGQVAVCEKYTSGVISYFNIGTQESAQFQYDSSMQRNYIQYTFGSITTKVYLQCDQNENGKLTSGPSVPMNPYTFTLTSKYCCPGASSAGRFEAHLSVLLVAVVSKLLM